MAFQTAFTPFLIASLVIPYILRHWMGSWLTYWVFPAVSVCTLLSLYAAAVLYTICVEPFLSPLKHLPKAPQAPVWQRLFKEPSAYHFEKWFRDVPNDGLIRYYGILNIERVLVTSQAYARQILQTHAYSYEKQYGQRTHLERVGGRGLVWHEGKMHRYLRRVLEPAFKSSVIMETYFAPVAQKTEEMLRLMQEIMGRDSISPASSDKQTGRDQLTTVLTMDEIVHKTVFDIMGLVAFGPDMDFQSIFRPELFYDPLEDYRLAFKPSPPNRIRVYSAFFLPTWMVNLLPIRFNLTTALAISRFRQIGKSWIDGQKSSLPTREGWFPTGNSFIMESVLRGGKLSDRDLLEQFSMLQAGGIHSTGAAIMSALWWLSHPDHLDVQRRLREEIHANVRSADPRSWSSPGTFASCHYLDAVISEVLRLHPPFSWLGRTPNHWTELGGTVIPPGLSISLSPWAAHRDPTIWGGDATSFRPERWLRTVGPPGATAKTVPASLQNLLSFGAGPRKCIAETLARMELQCVLAALFGRFDFQTVPGAKPPSVTHQSTLAFRSELRLQVSLVDW